MDTMQVDKAAEYDALASYYDLFYTRSGASDLAFYSGLARQTQGPVLELGCGTGRLAVPLAVEGFDVIGLDISPQMLNQARRKLAEMSPEVQARCRLREGDMRDFSLEQQFGLIIIAYSTLLELDSSVDRVSALQCCRKHLKPEGAVAIDNFFYGEGEHKDWGKYRPDHIVLYRGTYPDPTAPDGVIQHFESDIFDRSDMRPVKTIFVDHVSPYGAVQRETLAVSRRYVTPEQMEAELREAGFCNIEVYGGFNREPLYAPSLKGRGRQIFVAWA